MHWLFPGFLLGLGAAALPLLLHLLRRRPKRTIRFPSLRFLAATSQQNARAQRLRRWLVLLLRCAVFTLAAAAFARPFLANTATADRRATVIVVDNSFSLRAGTRWTALQNWLSAQIGNFGPGDRIGILRMGPRPEWICPVTTAAPAALDALRALEPGWESASVEASLRLAAQSVAATAADHRQVILLSDHQRVSWAGFNFEEKLPPGVDALFPEVPEALPRQAAIHEAKVTRVGDQFRADVSIRNYGPAQRRRLRVYRDGADVPVHDDAVELARHETRALSMNFPAGANAETAYFRISLDADELEADDSAYAVWQASGDRVVLLDRAPPGSDADYLRLALEISSGAGPSLRVQPVPANAWPANAVAVLRHPASFQGEAAKRLESFLAAGGAALVFVNEGAKAWLSATPGLQPRPLASGEPFLEVREWAWEHPLIKRLSAENVGPLLRWRFQRGWALPGDAVDPLALWPDGTVAIGETSTRPGHLLLCGFRPDRRDGEWPAREAFLPFVQAAVEYLLQADASTKARPARVGQPVTLPADSGSWTLLTGPKPGIAVVVTQSTVIPSAPGVYEFTSGGVRKHFAVNVAPEESDLEPWPEGTPWRELESSAPGTSARAPSLPAAAIEAEQQNALWWWLFLAVAVALLLELGLANRTAR